MAAVGREPAGAAAGFFRPLSADDEEQLPTELESLCMGCFRQVRAGGAALPGSPGAGVPPAARGSPAGPQPLPPSPQGVTRLLLTRIPFFREVIVGSFACGSCGWSNAEVQSAGRIQARGVRYALAVRSRQVGSLREGTPWSRPRAPCVLRPRPAALAPQGDPPSPPQRGRAGLGQSLRRGGGLLTEEAWGLPGAPGWVLLGQSSLC